MRMSAQIDKFTPAFVAAQAQMRGAFKDCVNPFHKSNYADLESVWDACKEPLNKNGLMVMQNFETIEGIPHLITMVCHISGQFIASEMKLPFPFDTVDRQGQVTHKNDPQALGSVVTYCRRYAMASAMGIVQTDDDCQSVVEAQKRTEPKVQESIPSKPKAPPKPMRQDQKDSIPETPFDSPLAQLKEFAAINKVDNKRLAEFVATRATAKKTTPEKIVDSALLNPEISHKFLSMYSDWLHGDHALTA
jgi:hypothetical protein